MVRTGNEFGKPFSVEVNYDVFDSRRPEGVIGILGGTCPNYGVCNHCSLPSYSLGFIDTEDQIAQFDFAFDKLIREESGVKVISMYNAGSAFNYKEISPEALNYFFSRASCFKRNGVLRGLEKVAVESREWFISDDKLAGAVDALGDLKLEVAFGCESYDDAVRNGDADNSRGRIGLNKKIDLARLEDAAGKVVSFGGDLKFYVMIGSVPWLKGEDVVEDVIGTAGYLYGFCCDSKISTNLHINPMYIARGSALADVWGEEISKGRARLPDWGDVVSCLEGIHSNVGKIGEDINVYLGLDSEGLGNTGISESGLNSLVKFNKTQDLEKLVSCKKFLEENND